MPKLIYSLDLHWLVDPSQIKQMSLSEFAGNYSINAFLLDSDRSIEIYKGSKEDCERRLDNFVSGLYLIQNGMRSIDLLTF